MSNIIHILLVVRPTSSIEVESLLVLHFTDSFVEQCHCLAKVALSEALHGKVIVGEDEVSGGILVDFTVLVVVALVHGC